MDARTFLKSFLGLFMLSITIGVTHCTKHNWSNPLDPGNSALWVKVADTPQTLGATSSNYLYNIGGEIFLLNTMGSQKAVYRLDYGEFSKWERIALASDGIFSPATTVFQDKIMVMSLSGGSNSYTIMEFDPATRAFGSATSIGKSKGEFSGLACSNNDLFAFESDTSESGTLSVYRLNSSSEGNERLSSTYPCREDYTTAMLNDEIYIIGGSRYSADTKVYSPTNAVEVFNPSANSWTEASAAPFQGDLLTASTYNGNIYVIDGKAGQVFKYSPSIDLWEKKSNISDYSPGLVAAAPYENVLLVGTKIEKVLRYRYRWSGGRWGRFPDKVTTEYKIHAYHASNE